MHFILQRIGNVLLSLSQFYVNFKFLSKFRHYLQRTAVAGLWHHPRSDVMCLPILHVTLVQAAVECLMSVLHNVSRIA
jgi:hypothetical protein